MSEIRKERAFDGVCTLFVGSGLIFSDLSEGEADRIAAALTPTGSAGVRRTIGRGRAGTFPNEGASAPHGASTGRGSHRRGL